MSMEFAIYLTGIIIVIIVLAVLAAIAIWKLLRRGGGDKKQPPISGGNVSVLFDDSRNVIIIPYVKDKMGVGRAAAGPQRLSMPYAAGQLGSAVRNSMRLSTGGKPITSYELMSQLGFNGWKEFSEGKRSISINYIEGSGVTFNTTIRRPDGSYQFNHFGIEKSVGGDIGDCELGGTILELLQRCR